jgi:hypothetical protein
MDAGLYFSDTKSDHSSCANDESNARSNAKSNAKPAPTPMPPTPTAFQAAMAWQGDDDDLSSHTGSPTSLDPVAFDLANSTSSSLPTNPISMALPTASDVANILLSLSDENSAGSDADFDVVLLRLQLTAEPEMSQPLTGSAQLCTQLWLQLPSLA